MPSRYLYGWEKIPGDLSSFSCASTLPVRLGSQSFNFLPSPPPCCLSVLFVVSCHSWLNLKLSVWASVPYHILALMHSVATGTYVLPSSQGKKKGNQSFYGNKKSDIGGGYCSQKRCLFQKNCVKVSYTLSFPFVWKIGSGCLKETIHLE